MRIGKYLKTAFVNRWNQLAFWGGVAFSVVSGRPDIGLPLVMAAEMAYLGFLGTHPKFQRHIDAQEAAVRRQGQSKSSEKMLRKILKSLPRDSYRRYERLRDSCVELRQIAHDMKPGRLVDDPIPFDSLQIASLDRLLWIFLRLLYTHHQLGRFLERTNVDSIRNDIGRIENRLAQIGETENSTHAQRKRQSLEDHLKTCQQRLDNYAKAEGNFELVELEIDRVENKIKSLAELAVNRQEPEFVSSQVDEVASSMLETEKTISELDFATGIGGLEEEAPEMLWPRVEVVE